MLIKMRRVNMDVIVMQVLLLGLIVVSAFGSNLFG